MATIDLSEASAPAVLRAMRGGEPDTWLIYYRGFNPYLEAVPRHGEVALAVREAAHAGKVFAVLRRTTPADSPVAGIYEYMVKVPARKEARA